ncbi:MAG: aldehyde ferredoxin oxidoreductase family protein [Methanoregulaceae archaeon]|nr:aldehyde ferredoxin oxidoreductase family protein [Methanoregulaceae archaeon]
MDGYTGTILYVDLSRGSINPKPFPEGYKRLYIGGRGLGVRLLSDLVDPGTDPDSDANVLVFATGPLTGSIMPLGSRYDVITKSPLTGTVTSANSGGFFGPTMKRAGFDAVVFLGRAADPVYLSLKEDTAELRDAAPLKGMTTTGTTGAIQEDLGDPKARVSCIGPAGENRCRFASIMNEGTRAAGRGGVGAVMGGKNLKAVAVSGEGTIEPADIAAAREARDEIRKKIEENPITGKGLHNYGTSVLVNIINESHILPTRNYQSAYFPQAEALSGETQKEKIVKRGKGCFGCLVACGRETEEAGEKGEGPEYETTWAFGPDLGISDLSVVTSANHLCNELGLDTISTGATIACAMEMSEKGYIKEQIKWGDGPAVLDLVRKIATRDGIGDELAEGSFRFASKYGHPELSMSVKKQELPAYDPRGLQGHGLEYATSVRGGDHVYGYMIAPEVLGSPQKLDPFTDEGKAAWTKTFQDLTAAIDASGLCLFTSFAIGAPEYARMVSAVTGMNLDAGELLKIGERIWNLQRMFNIRAGFSDSDDTLPVRLLTEPLHEGAPKDRVWVREPLLSQYYQLRGWDEKGVPTPEKLQELGIA